MRLKQSSSLIIWNKHKKERYSRFSTLSVLFNTQEGVNILDTIGDKILPEVDSLVLKNVGYQPGRFERFLAMNFPAQVNSFSVYNADMNLVGLRLSNAYKIVKERVKKEINLDGFHISTYNLEDLLSMSSHLERINFSGWKLADSEEILLEKDFKNLKDLNLEGIGLSQTNIGLIGKFQTNNFNSWLFHSKKDYQPSSEFKSLPWRDGSLPSTIRYEVA